jgi:DNA-binding NtrC family response regulator
LIHEKSGAQNHQPFVAINCAAIPVALWEDELFGHVRGAFTDARNVRNGKVMDAGRGTLFLDEIGEMPLEMQAKMLRLVQERQFSQIGSEKIVTADCRFIFATNKNLEECVRAGNFRDDLYYRINVLQIELPPLRERKEDLPLLIDHFLKKMNQELGCQAEGIDDRAYRALARYDWPGNIRELENLLIRTVAGSDVRIISPHHLPMLVSGAIAGPPPGGALPVISDSDGSFEERMREFARTLIKDALQKTGGRKNRAAELLGMKRGRFFYQLKELGIQDNEAT